MPESVSRPGEMRSEKSPLVLAIKPWWFLLETFWWEQNQLAGAQRGKGKEESEHVDDTEEVWLYRYTST